MGIFSSSFSGIKAVHRIPPTDHQRLSLSLLKPSVAGAEPPSTPLCKRTPWLPESAIGGRPLWTQMVDEQTPFDVTICFLNLVTQATALSSEGHGECL